MNSRLLQEAFEHIQALAHQITTLWHFAIRAELVNGFRQEFREQFARTTGIDTLQAAKLAADRGVRIHVVGLGTRMPNAAVDITRARWHCRHQIRNR